MLTYAEQLARHIRPDGRLTDFLALRDGRLIYGGEVDLLAEAKRYGAPLEIVLCPQISARIQAMQGYFADARVRAGYAGEFVYAYATKANFAEEVVRTAIASCAHYETSSAYDVRVAAQLWRSGTLPSDRFVFCNGSKERPYIDAILELRTAGCETLVPILDDPYEFSELASCPAPLLFGLRERKDAGDLTEGATYGYDRFGLLPDEIDQIGGQVAGTGHKIILYHAMVGSQLEDERFFLRELRESLAGFARARERIPTLAYFNFGGGFPTDAYSLDFDFDYAGVVERLVRTVAEECQALGIPVPHLVGEFGRYTVADHGVHIFRIARRKVTQPGFAAGYPWYLVDGSLMVSLPDILIVAGQSFITLALNHLDRAATVAVLGGRRTCDSDDFYPRTGGLALPDITADELARDPLYIAFFGTGAYQSMLSGEGGAHHCLAPEAPKLILEAGPGQLTRRLVPEQSWEDVLSELGYVS
jgi:arginine decarboxylase